MAALLPAFIGGGIGLGNIKKVILNIQLFLTLKTKLMRLVIHLCKQDTHPPPLIPIHYIQQTGYEKKTQTYQEEVVILM